MLSAPLQRYCPSVPRLLPILLRGLLDHTYIGWILDVLRLPVWHSRGDDVWLCPVFRRTHSSPGYSWPHANVVSLNIWASNLSEAFILYRLANLLLGLRANGTICSQEQYNHNAKVLRQSRAGIEYPW